MSIFFGLELIIFSMDSLTLKGKLKALAKSLAVPVGNIPKRFINL